MSRSVKSFYSTIIVLVCFCMTFSLISPKQARATETVVAFGDSITAGWPYQTYNGNGCTSCGGYEYSLQDLFNWSGRDAIVYNYGVPGELTGNGLNRIDWVMLGSAADYVLLMEGTNDLTFYVDPGTVAYMVYWMAWKVYLWGGKPIMATITPDTRFGWDWKNVGVANEWIRYYARISPWVHLSDQNAAIAPYWNQGYNYDGLHPNWWGYWVIANTWFYDMLAL
jgi:lysophospholipase L1-like esterase